MKTLHLSIITIAGIAIAGTFYLTEAFADNGNPLTGSGPPNIQLSGIVASGNNVYVAYKTNINPQEIFFRKSTDGGSTFDKIIKINDDNAYFSEPHMSVSGNNIYITWYAAYVNGSEKILFKRSTDGGNSFGNAIVLDPNVSKGEAVIYEILATDSNVYIATNYNNSTSHVNHIFRTSTDFGKTFGKPVIIVNSESLNTKIAVSKPNIYVILVEESICPPSVLEDCQKSSVFFKKSIDNGTTFTKTVNLSNGTLAIAPQMATSKNNVFVVWQEGQYPNILLTKSSDGGSNFNNKINLSKDLLYSIEPQIAVATDNVYVIFYHNMYSSSDVKNSNQGLYLTKSLDDGNTFSDPIKLTNATASNYDISSGKNLYVIWNDFNHTRNRWDVFFTKSTDNGTTFDSVINLSSEVKSGGAYGMTAVEGNNVYVGWLTQSYDDIYFRASHDNGNTFGNLVNINHEETVPEFPFAVPILLAGTISSIVFYRIKFRK